MFVPAMFLHAKQCSWWQIIKLTHARWVAVDGDQRAAAFAYYLLLSLLPLLFMLVSVGSLFVERSVATREVVQWINHYIPLSSEQANYTESTIRGVLASRGKFSLAAFLIFLWSAVNFLRTLIRSTNRIWHLPTYHWWRRPTRSLGLLSITASAVLFGFFLPGFAKIFRSWPTLHFEFPSWAFALIFLFIPWIVLFYGLLMIYKLSPNRITEFADVWLGALSVTILIWLSERLFMIYATNFANFNVLYGTLGGIVAVLLWLYLSSCLGLLGICFCAARAHFKSSHAESVSVSHDEINRITK